MKTMSTLLEQMLKYIRLCDHFSIIVLTISVQFTSLCIVLHKWWIAIHNLILYNVMYEESLLTHTSTVVNGRRQI